MIRALAAPCVAASLAALALSSVVPATLTAQPAYETTRVADGVWQFRWQSHNGLIITTPDGVVAVDPIGPEAAARFAQEIRRVAPGAPLLAVVYSHSDADHATGAPALIAGMGAQNVPIIAHENAVAPIRQRGSPDLPEPTVTFAERMTLAPGGRRIELHYLGPSHTDNMIVPYLPDVGVAFAVDFVSNDRMGYQELPGWAFPEFFGAVSGLLALPFETMVFGHGPPGDRATIRRQIDYYDDLTAAVRRAVAEGLTEDQAAERIRLPEYSRWEQYDAWLPMNVRAVYRWVAGEGG